MPYQFEYRINNTNHLFRCNITSVRCEANTKTGARCSRMCAIGTPFCYSHLLSEKRLRIKDSIHGKGLFAQVSRSPADQRVVFRDRDVIVEYTGETIDVDTLNSRYDLDEDTQYTAPYAYEIRKDASYVDSACNRGIASLANHKSRSRANAKFVKTRNANGVYTGVKLVATKSIKNNREIFACYGTNYSFHDPTTHRTTYRRRNSSRF